MIRHRILFQVDIAHDYFLSRGALVFEAQPERDQTALARLFTLPSILRVVPDEGTHACLAGHKMLFRATDSGFLVAVQLDPSASDMRPALPPAPHFRLVFGLRLRDPHFANYTELGPADPGFFRFGNDSQNSVLGTAFLSRRVASFDASRRYVAGEAYAQAAGETFNLFVARRDTGPAASPVAVDWSRIPADTFDPVVNYPTGAIVLSANRVYRALVDGPGNDFDNAAEWQTIATLPNQYATFADAMRRVTGLLDVDLSDVGQLELTLQIFAGDDTAHAAEKTFTDASGMVGHVQLDLRGLMPGRYRVEVLDASRSLVPGRGFSIYLSPEAARRGWFGVIEIGTGAGDFALFNLDGTLRSPRFVLRFLNRASRWRYIFPADQAVGTGAEVAPEAGNPRVLVTAAPLGLTRFGNGSRLQADSATTPTVSEEILLPAPEVKRIRRESAGWFSETHVANLPVGP